MNVRSFHDTHGRVGASRPLTTVSIKLSKPTLLGLSFAHRANATILCPILVNLHISILVVLPQDVATPLISLVQAPLTLVSN